MARKKTHRSRNALSAPSTPLKSKPISAVSSLKKRMIVSAPATPYPIPRPLPRGEPQKPIRPSENRRRTREWLERVKAEDCNPEASGLLQQALEEYFTHGLLATFDHECGDWKEVLWPYVETESEITPLPPNLFSLDLPTVYCPHIMNERRSIEECTGHLNLSDGDVYLQAKHFNHNDCSFKIRIPDVDAETAVCTKPWKQDLRSPDVLKRATCDLTFCTTLEHDYQNGSFNLTDSTHPAHQDQPLNFNLWDIPAYSRHLGLVYNTYNTFRGGPLDRCLEGLHSEHGLPRSTWNAIRDDVVICEICNCAFSAPAYREHLNGNACGNWLCRAGVTVQAPVRNVTFDPPRPASAEEYFNFHETTLYAFKQWNSRIGVTRNAWAVLSTMAIECSECLRYRTYPAHKSHRAHGCI